MKCYSETMKNVGYCVAVQNGQYGEVRLQGSERVFRPYGRVIELLKVFRSCETKEIWMLVRFRSAADENITMLIPKGDFADAGIAKVLSSMGACVSSRRIDLLQALMNQSFEKFREPITNYHTGLGWLPVDGSVTFRDFRNCGSFSLYRGVFDIKPSGSFDIWRKAMEQHVLPYQSLAVALLAGLSSVLVGFMHSSTPLLNPIFSLAGGSSTGKSTAGIVAASTAFRPILGTSFATDEATGETVQLVGGVSSWAATKNALITRLQGNGGFPVVLDELSKSEIGDLSAVVYALSEGADKDRLQKDCTLRPQESFHTSILSIGEERLIDRCKKQQEGLQIRIFEIPGPFTKSAKHANRLVEICRTNYGHAAPLLANKLSELGEDTVLEIYKQACKKAKKWLPQTAFRERRVQQFHGLLLATAIIARDALGLKFDFDSVLEFLRLQEADAAISQDKVAVAYQRFIEWVGINLEHFALDLQNRDRFGLFYSSSEIPRKRSLPEHVVGEIAVFPSIFSKYCTIFGYTNQAALLKAWKDRGIVVAEPGKNTLRRKIDGVQQTVIVVRRFEDAICQKQKAKQTREAIQNDDLEGLVEDIEEEMTSEGGQR